MFYTSSGGNPYFLIQSIRQLDGLPDESFASGIKLGTLGWSGFCQKSVKKFGDFYLTAKLTARHDFMEKTVGRVNLVTSLRVRDF